MLERLVHVQAGAPRAPVISIAHTSARPCEISTAAAALLSVAELGICAAPPNNGDA